MMTVTQRRLNCVDVDAVYFLGMLQSGTMTKDQLLSMRDDMEDTIDAMGSSLVKSMGVAYAVSADKAAGVDMDQVQKDYLWIVRTENGWHGTVDGSCYRTW